jgi:HK97 gp10 family phage protein
MTTTKGRNFIVSWTPDQFVKGMEARHAKALELMAIAYEGDVKRALSKPGPMKSKPTRGQRARLTNAKEQRRASLPGEPPRRRTGALRASIGHASREGGRIQRVGSSMPYSRPLEWGTARMKPRPFFRPTLRRNIKRYTDIYLRTMRHGG